MSSGERAVGHEGNVHFPADGNELTLIFPVEQVVVVLHSLEHSPPVLPGYSLHPEELIPVHGRRSKGADLAGPHESVERLYGLLDGRFIVKAVDDVEIQIVRAETAQRPVDLPGDGLAGQTPGIKIDF